MKTTCHCGADGRGPCATWCRWRESKTTVEATIDEHDIELHAWPQHGRSGGQHTNRMSCGVLALHKPTGLAVVSTSERSQLSNKNAAITRLRVMVQLYRDGAATTPMNLITGDSFDR